MKLHSFLWQCLEINSLHHSNSTSMTFSGDWEEPRDRQSIANWSTAVGRGGVWEKQWTWKSTNSQAAILTFGCMDSWACLKYEWLSFTFTLSWIFHNFESWRRGEKNQPTHHLSPILHSPSAFSKGMLGELGSEILPEQYRMQMPLFQKILSKTQHSVDILRSDGITVDWDPLSILNFLKRITFLFCF